jgi:DNA-binding transcriptional LysR family regulator
MNIHDIEIFLAIIRTRSISKAAEARFLSQSTISHRLKALESSLGIILLERHRGRTNIKLTPEGETFVGIARKWVTLHEETYKLKGETTRLRLAVAGVDSAIYYIFPPLFRRLLHNDPPLELDIRSHHSVEIHSLLERGAVDIGFVNHDARSASIVAEPIIEERFRVLRLKSGNTLLEPVHPEDLDPSKELLHAWFPAYQAWHDFWWDPDKQAVARFNVPSLLQGFFDDEKVWAIVPESVARVLTAANTLQAHEILSPPPNRVVYCVTNKYTRSNSVAMQIFRRHMEAFLQDLPKSR